MMSKVTDDKLPDVSFKKLSMAPYVSRIPLPDIVPDTMLLTQQRRGLNGETERQREREQKIKRRSTSVGCYARLGKQLQESGEKSPAIEQQH